MNIWYMNGAGNDFTVLDARGQEYDFQSLSKKLCKLKNADGFMAVDESDKADFRLHFYNADGSRGEMCGNGARCICRFAYDNGIAGEAMTLETDAGIVRGWRIDENTYRVQLNDPSALELHRKGDIAYVELGAPGVPHAVLEVPGLEWSMKEQLRQRAKALRYDPAFPKGANVNMYTWLPDGSIRILTYERGVEDYTLACGTGSASTAAVLQKLGKLTGDTLAVHNPGGTLTVTIHGGLFLQGPTQVVEILEYSQGGMTP